jgi:hypothetical protein
MRFKSLWGFRPSTNALGPWKIGTSPYNICRMIELNVTHYLKGRTMVRNRLTRTFALASLLLLTLGVSCAFADQIYTLDAPNSALSGFTGPFAKATVHLVNPALVLLLLF